VDGFQTCQVSGTAIKDFLRVHFAGQEQRSFVVLFLDAFRGTLTQTSVYPREVLRKAQGP